MDTLMLILTLALIVYTISIGGLLVAAYGLMGWNSGWRYCRPIVYSRVTLAWVLFLVLIVVAKVRA